MILNLLAILFFLAAMIAAIVLLWRRLPGASATAEGEVVCLACGAPAQQFAADSFVCPSCGHDARQMGLAAKLPRVTADPFWRFIAFTVLLCALALGATLSLLKEFRRTDTIGSDAEFWSDGTRSYRILLNTQISHDPRKDATAGNLEGNLIAGSGRLVTLEIQSPSLHYDVVEDGGRVLVPLSQGALDEAAILKWLTVGELDPSDLVVRGIARRTYVTICNKLNVEPAQLPRLDLPSMSGGSSGSYSTSESAPAALMPVSIISWSIVWLLGTWLILRAGQRKSVQRAVKEGAAV